MPETVETTFEQDLKEMADKLFVRRRRIQEREEDLKLELKGLARERRRIESGLKAFGLMEVPDRRPVAVTKPNGQLTPEKIMAVKRTLAGYGDEMWTTNKAVHDTDGV